MDVYRRHFLVESKEMVEAVKQANNTNDKANEEYLVILKDIGAKSIYYRYEGRIVGLLFEDEPDRYLYKELRSGWWPKKNTKKAKAIWKRLSDVKAVNVNSCLKIINLSTNPTIFTAGKAYYPVLIVLPYAKPKLLVSIPWYDEDPKVLRKYVEDNKKGVHHCTNKNAVLWEPLEGMTEIKGWERDKAIDQYNESITKEE